jgi:hypothetical protein
MTQRRQFLRITIAGSAAIIAGCTGESESDNNGETISNNPDTARPTTTAVPESTTPKTTSSASSGESDAEVVLEYSITTGKSPEQVPSSISKSRDDGGRRKEGYRWVVISFDVTQGTLNMQDVWFRSRVETSERFYDLDHGTADLTDGVQSRGEIKQRASGIALYQIPEDAENYSWNLEEMRQDVEATNR